MMANDLSGMDKALITSAMQEEQTKLSTEIDQLVREGCSVIEVSAKPGKAKVYLLEDFCRQRGMNVGTVLCGIDNHGWVNDFIKDSKHDAYIIDLGSCNLLAKDFQHADGKLFFFTKSSNEDGYKVSAADKE